MKKSEYNIDNYSFFDEPDDTEKSIESGIRLDVVKYDYIQAERLTWKELFSGFNSIYAITFSSSINFIFQLFDMFKTAEVIFGCEEIMSLSLQEIMAYQTKIIERLRNNQGYAKSNLLQKIDSGNVRLYVAREKLSHEKIYLLSDENGKKRVVFGSANMSYNAFGGKQRENICYTDSADAYEWYMGVYQTLKEDSTDEISHKALDIADCEDNADQLPISDTVRVKRALTIETTSQTDEDIEFILDVRNLAKKIAPDVPQPEKKSGKIILTPDKVSKIRRQIQDDSQKERDIRSEYPQFQVDIVRQKAVLNGVELDLVPSSEDVRRDVGLFIQYMNGYERFHGDYFGMQCRYYEFANWFFCSPFMAVMRDYALRYNQPTLPYPVFGLVCGHSKAGKTSFLETLLKMMIGQKPKISAPEFTRSSIDALKNTVQGAPIIVDDLTNTRFSQHAVETIKNETFGFSNHLIYYPAVVISANEDVKAVSHEVTRRTVICRVEAALTDTEVMQSNIVKTVQKKVGTAFYRYYLRRMFDIMPDIIDAITDDTSEKAPDILQKSSEIFHEIIKENCDVLPEYVRKLSLEDYFGEAVTGQSAKKIVCNAWKTSRSAFRVNKRLNELRYNAGQTFDADRLLKELPETLEARKSREWVVMNLDTAQLFFGLSFRKGLFN